MNKIDIIDNFLDENDLKTIKNIIIAKLWKYGHTSGGIELITNKFFSDYFTRNFNDTILKKIKLLYCSRNFKIIRLYTHIQTFGQDGAYHVDYKADNKFSFCLYISIINDDLLEDKQGGDFLIKIPNEKFIISITPNNNRGILFPANYLHKGNAYSRHFSERRICITWKLEEII